MIYGKRGTRNILAYVVGPLRYPDGKVECAVEVFQVLLEIRCVHVVIIWSRVEFPSVFALIHTQMEAHEGRRSLDCNFRCTPTANLVSKSSHPDRWMERASPDGYLETSTAR